MERWLQLKVFSSVCPIRLMTRCENRLTQVSRLYRYALSEVGQLTRYGFLGKLDIAIIEVARSPKKATLSDDFLRKFRILRAYCRYCHC